MSDVMSASLKDAVKIIAVSKKMTVSEVARASGRAQSTVAGMMSKGNVSLRVLAELLEGVDEDLVICLKNGQKIKLEL